jgi:hypothetical protein
MDGFSRELEGKMSRKEMNDELLQYSSDIWKILQDIYRNRIQEVYRYAHNQIPEESIKRISDEL